ncbi:MAG TPA: SDR family NAD(P)-dependent oxidoreductase, partial [Vicinamibacterales bacterium]
MAVPPIIDAAEFEAVQTLLKTRSPALTAPRVVSGPTLLTGICFCAACGGAMTLRTGKSGRYRYYTCCTKARQGETGCKGRTVPMEKLDSVVAEHIAHRLLQPKRLEQILSRVLDRREERAERRTAHVAELRRRAAEAEAKLKRLYDAIENGVADLADAVLKERVTELKAIRDQAGADAERAEGALDRIGPRITPQALKTFASQARRRMRTEAGGYRRDHVRALAQRVEVDAKEVRIMGSKSVLLRTLVAASGAKTAGFGVPSFVPKWRTNEDKNAAALAKLKGHGIKAMALRCDVSDETAVDRCFAETVETLGRVDACFANAGVGGGGRARNFAEMPTAEWRRVMNVNLDGAFFTLRAGARHMIERGGGGSLAATASLAGVMGAARNEHYSATKGGLMAMIRSMAVELARHQIRANTIVP